MNRSKELISLALKEWKRKIDSCECRNGIMYYDGDMTDPIPCNKCSHERAMIKKWCWHEMENGEWVHALDDEEPCIHCDKTTRQANVPALTSSRARKHRVVELAEDLDILDAFSDHLTMTVTFSHIGCEFVDVKGILKIITDANRFIEAMTAFMKDKAE